MITFTKEQLIARIKQVTAINKYRIGRDPSADGLAMDNELFAIALASLEAEPVGEVVLGEYDDCGCHPDARVACIAADGQADWENFKDGTRLYTAPPAPVSVPDERYQNLSELYHAQENRLFKLAQRIKGPSFDKYAHSPSQAIDVLESAIFGERADDACHAAMLQSFGNSEQLNSPVIPEGWVACSERMPEAGDDMIVFTDDIVMSGISYSKKKGFYIQALEYDDDEPVDNVTHWMPLPAAPQQEVK
ncbi:DUF551 domain-containing protein [Enterobacter hormaechei]|uniref:DUF551 domain-containing protein n=1 Tax=Enterobacter hormaechei TaxID=158836 RepID=UPI00198169B7|nr:DUF551 domain-containing protein [Enterobacter hormaechei]MBN4831699.1 DUF551 domain-containing protein [Enterobacter hormaechei]